MGTVGACLALLLLGPGEERPLRLGDEDVGIDVPDASPWRWVEPGRTSLEASWPLVDRLRIYAMVSTAPVSLEDPFQDPDAAFRPAAAGGLRLDGGMTVDLCAHWSLTGGYTRFSGDLTDSSSKEDRVRAMLDGGGYFLALDLRF